MKNLATPPGKTKMETEGCAFVLFRAADNNRGGGGAELKGPIFNPFLGLRLQRSSLAFINYQKISLHLQKMTYLALYLQPLGKKKENHTFLKSGTSRRRKKKKKFRRVRRQDRDTHRCLNSASYGTFKKTVASSGLRWLHQGYIFSCVWHR